MLSRIFIFLCRSPALKRKLWKGWYNFLAARYRRPDWTFMNYGFVPPPELPTLTLDAEDEANRYCIQLYHRVASETDFQGKAVLEVGSGRGGGTSYVRRYLSPATVIGVDFCASAVAFCRQRHRLEGLRFEEGSAEALPFTDSVFDVVLNVESSHCYASMESFLSEVRRVLVTGGLFLYADLRDAAGLSEWRRQLQTSRLTILSETDITKEVLASLDADNERKAAKIRELIPRPFRSSFEDFAGLRGSAIFEGFRSGRFTYRLFVLRKT
jgi:SAM-dependent methyltransferase